jgi:glycyl-tRNA synthetase
LAWNPCPAGCCPADRRPALPPLPPHRSERITLDLDARRAAIWAGASAAAAEAGGAIPESARGDLLDEVANLVESPTVVRGAFDPAFLKLPE